MTRSTVPNSLAAVAPATLLLALVLAAATGGAGAEDNQTPVTSQQTAPPGTQVVPPQPQPAGRPGFLHQLKVWWDDSAWFFDQGIKGTRGAFDNLGQKSGDTAKNAASIAEDAMKKTLDVGKDAATAIEKLPNTRVMTLRELCEKAPNGAPDCEAAAAKGCRNRGFSGGHPLDVRSAENCDLAALRAGKSPGRNECPVDTVVTRAICQ